MISGLIFALIFYLTYAFAGGAWTNAGFIALSMLLVFTGPLFARWSGVVEQFAAGRTGSQLAARAARFLFQWAVNVALVAVLILCGVASRDAVAALGGLVIAAGLTSFGSQGLQYAALWLAGRGWGRPQANVLAALAASMMMNSAALTSLGLAQRGLQIFNIVLVVAGLAIAIRSDAMSLFRQ